MNKKESEVKYMKIQKMNAVSHSVEGYASCVCNMAMCSCSISYCACACQTYNPEQTDANSAYNKVLSGRRSSVTYSSGNSSVG